MNVNESVRAGLQFTHLGLTMVVIVFLFGGGGYYLDGYFGTGNTLTVVGFIVGVFMGLGYFVVEIYRLATEGFDREDDADNDQTDGSAP